ncbi:hypothetical protein [Pseudonocardia thermophila]|uniref:hypothetical protein n=1 Tax=Pseudonocardia thermophila TaxID=1848 RepID=UPI00248D3D61|nr:hypothetical protein [Pseudonocardia thermophila]
MTAAGARSVRRLAALAAGLAVLLAGCAGGPPQRGTAIEGPDGSDVFRAADSVWHRPIPANAPIDPRSAEYVRQLMVKPDRSKEAPVVSVNGYTIPVYEAAADTPRYRVVAGKDFVAGGWALPAVPIPDNAAPDSREDGHLVVLDRSSGCVYEFWQARFDDGAWTASWVNATPIDGAGVYPDGLAARGTGISAAAGLIWPQELAAGRIDHALAFATPWVRRDAAVSPATTSDGRAAPDVPALPAGARLRLDPALNLDALGLSPEQRAIAEALQKYGMILVDTSGGLTLYAAAPQAYTRFPYPVEWASSIWADIDEIPFDRMQVLELPEPAGRPAVAPVLNRCTQDAVHGRGPGPSTRGADPDD